MAKQASAGELRTRIYIRKTIKGTGGNGVPTEQEVSAFPPGPDDKERVWHCKWVNAYGTEALTAMQYKIQEPATLTMRYSPLVQPDQRVYRLGDPIPFEIISVNDVEGRHSWLEVKVKRGRAAR